MGSNRNRGQDSPWTVAPAEEKVEEEEENEMFSYTSNIKGLKFKDKAEHI
jgi:hypothetical protein